jgi:TonB family protein
MALPDSHPSDLDSDAAVGAARTEPREVFGGYLLFERLKRDALGEVYRAGQFGANGVERVFSLRLFNGSEIEGERFWEACRSRLPLSRTLREETFVPIVETGFESGVPFVAREHIFGRTLAELLERARELSYPIPLECTLHLMERIALGLRHAYGTLLEGERVVHGFLTPEFVHVSSEGQVRLTGFESVGGLLGLAVDGPTRSALAGYLSPEVNAGEPAQAADDVYTLGTIFGELLTGEQLPPFDSDGTGRWVEGAVLSTEAAPLPDDVRQLLSESLLPRDHRIQDAERWHEALLVVATAGDCNATAFSIAYLMNTLFGDELDQEVLLVEAEKQAEELAPAEVPTAEPDSAALPPISAQPGSLSVSDAGSGRRWMAIAAAVVLLGGLAVAYFFFDVPTPDASPTEARPLPVAAVAAVAAPRPDDPPVPAAGEESEEAGPAAATEPDGDAELYPDEVEVLRSLVDQRTGELETTLRARYDARIDQLRAEIEQTSQTEASPPAETSDRAGDGTPRRTVEPQGDRQASDPAVEEDQTSTTSGEPDTPAATALTQEAPAEARTSDPAADRSPAQDRARQASPEPAVEVSEPPRLEREPAVVAAAPEPVQPGSIVVSGPGVTPPRLVRQPTVVYPPAARRLNRRATVRVRVLVDENGKVSQVEQGIEKVGLGFDQAALEAARTTRWTPPERDGVKVKMWVGLSLDFRP